jgi:prevent-host-death family protein
MPLRDSKKVPALKAKRRASSQYWQLQTAKSQFSEIFRRARKEAPQVVLSQGKGAVAVVAIEEFIRLTQRADKPQSLAKFFADSPLVGSGIDLERTSGTVASRRLN